MKEVNRSMTLPLVTAVLVALMVVAIGMRASNKSVR